MPVACVKFKIHHISQEGIVMFRPIRDDDNLLLFGALNLDTGKWPTATEEYRKAQERGAIFIFNGERFREVA